MQNNLFVQLQNLWKTLPFFSEAKNYKKYIHKKMFFIVGVALPMRFC